MHLSIQLNKAEDGLIFGGLGLGYMKPKIGDVWTWIQFGQLPASPVPSHTFQQKVL